jgi:hypothetical protein
VRATASYGITYAGRISPAIRRRFSASANPLKNDAAARAHAHVRIKEGTEGGNEMGATDQQWRMWPPPGNAATTTAWVSTQVCTQCTAWQPCSQSPSGCAQSTAGTLPDTGNNTPCLATRTQHGHTAHTQHTTHFTVHGWQLPNADTLPVVVTQTLLMPNL